MKELPDSLSMIHMVAWDPPRLLQVSCPPLLEPLVTDLYSRMQSNKWRHTSEIRRKDTCFGGWYSSPIVISSPMFPLHVYWWNSVFLFFFLMLSLCLLLESMFAGPFYIIHFSAKQRGWVSATTLLQERLPTYLYLVRISCIYIYICMVGGFNPS